MSSALIIWLYNFKLNVMKSPEENDNNTEQENIHDPVNDVETVASKNDNMEPVPDQEQLERKKS